MPDRGIDQFAHRAAVLRPGIAAIGEITRDDRVARRPGVARGTDDGVEQFDRRLRAGLGSHRKDWGMRVMALP